jgi:hypothetical protein
LYGGFVWARGARDSQNPRFPARAVTDDFFKYRAALQGARLSVSRID